jgi:hypothetical protein
MKNIFRFQLVVLCLINSANPLRAQWVQTNWPSTSSIQCFAVSGPNLFAGTSGGGVFLSTNSGGSWAGVDSGLTKTYVFALAVSPNGAGGMNLFAGTWGGVFLSTNSGTNWTAVDSGLTKTFVYALAVSPNGAGGMNLFAGTDGGVFLSTNNGTSWTAVLPMNTNVSAFAVSGTNIFAGTGNGGIFLSTNNGLSWTAVDSGLTSYYDYVYALAVSGTNLFGAIQGGVFLSTNNGTSWTAVSSGLTSAVYALAVSGTNLFAGTSGGGVFLSINNGITWTAVDSGLTNSDVRALAVSDTNLFAGTDDDAVWWRSIPEMIASVSPPTIVLGQPVIAFGSVRDDSTTIDTFRLTTSTFHPLIIKGVYTGTRWFAVTDVQDTVNEGDTLSVLVSFTPDTAKTYLDTLFIWSNPGNSLTRVPLSGNGTITAVSQNNSGIPKSYGISQNYPNPFNPTTVINYQLPVNSSVTLKIYDVLGREVETLVDERQNAGSYNVTFNAGNLPSGVYFYRLSAGSSGQAGSFTQTKKLVVIK